MSKTTIACPHCNYSREVPLARIPAAAFQVICPKCRQRFPWQPDSRLLRPPAGTATVDRPKSDERQEQPPSSRNCGASIARDFEPPAEKSAANDPPSPRETVARAPKAGFTLRCAAAAIDMVVYLAVLLLVVIGMLLIAARHGGDNPQALNMIGLLGGFVVLAFDYLYRVFFIGYCGQTPGKMTTRIKVVRCNGDEVGFGAAIFREIIGKFISTLLFLIGYLMIGFDEQRQGLHDKIADTYVIKL